MKTRLARYISIVLVLSFLMAMVGCSAKDIKTTISSVKPMEKEESKAISFDIIGGKDVMPLGGYYGPDDYAYSTDGNTRPDYFTDEIFQKIVDLGINMITYTEIDNTMYPDSVHKLLEMTSKYGLGYIPWDREISYKTDNMSLSATQSAERIAEWYDYESYCAQWIVDEPHTLYHGGNADMYIDKFENMAKAVNTELGLHTYMNMVPTLSVSDKAIENYHRYVKEFCDTLEPHILMWDTYPFRKHLVDGDASCNPQQYIVSLSIVRKYAEEYGIPFWSFIQVGNQYNDNYAATLDPLTPTEAQFNWNVNTALAYGSQGLQFFCLIEPHWDSMTETGSIDTHRSGLIGVMGNKTVWYYYLQNLTKHIQVIDEVLMNSVNKGVIISGEQAKGDFAKAECVLKGEKFQELRSIENDTDVMVGCFNYNGKTALYVVNYSYEYAQHVTLNFDQQHNITVTQLAEKSYVNTDSLTLDMAAGEGVLVIIE